MEKECALIAPHAASLDGEEETVLLHKRGGRGEEKVVDYPTDICETHGPNLTSNKRREVQYTGGLSCLLVPRTRTRTYNQLTNRTHVFLYQFLAPGNLIISPSSL